MKPWTGYEGVIHSLVQPLQNDNVRVCQRIVLVIEAELLATQ